MRAFSRSIAFATAFSPVFISPQVLADCSAILEQGIRNTYLFKNSGNFRSSFSDAFCSSVAQASNGGSKTTAGLSIPIPELGTVGFNGGHANSQSLKSSNDQCKADSGQLSDQNYTAALQLVADQNIVQAWSNCNDHAAGLFVNGELKDATNIEIEMYFRNFGGVSQTVLTTKPSIIGAICEDIPWAKGSIVNGARQYAQCKRIGTSAVSFVVNSEIDGAKFYIPEPVNPNPPDRHQDPVVKDCQGGMRIEGFPDCIRPGVDETISKICVPKKYGIGLDIPNTAPRCVVKPSSTVGSDCQCEGGNGGPMFPGTTAVILIKGVLKAPE